MPASKGLAPSPLRRATTSSALAMIKRAFALKQPSVPVVNLAVWSFCKNRALPLRGGDFGMPDGACVRLDGSDASTVLSQSPR